MPEILEVELYRALAEQALDREIARVWMVDSRYGRGGTTPPRLRAALVGRSFRRAARRGSSSCSTPTGGPTLGLRFGMTGGLVVDGREALDRLRYGPGVFDDKWVRMRVTFDDGGQLLMHDPRRFGSVEIAPNEGRLGPDALTVTLRELRAALSISPGRGTNAAPLKARLMDQERLAGVGNLLADEILWRADLAPGRRTPLSEAEFRRLHTALRATLRQLSRRGGSHMGELMEERRHDEGRCPRDGTELRREVVGGRTTYWCPAHQHCVKSAQLHDFIPPNPSSRRSPPGPGRRGRSCSDVGLYQARWTLPLGPTRKVERMVPDRLLAVHRFQPHAPYFSITFLSASVRSGKLGAVLGPELHVLLALSGEIREHGHAGLLEGLQVVVELARLLGASRRVVGV